LKNNMKKDMCIDKKTVFVTGGTSDIGREIALTFAKNGWNILIHYNSNKKKAEEVSKVIKNLGCVCSIFKADFTSEKQIKLLIDEIEGFQIDSLINNAGTYIEGRHYRELGLEIINKTFMVNTFVPLLLSAALIDKMKRKGFGRIVNISSVAAKYGGSSYSVHYGASKRALEGITKSLAKDGAEYNVLVNTVRPGVIDTDFHRKFPKDMDKRIAMIPAKKMGTSLDIAEIVYYLGSEKNNYITNEIITVAGGE